jgi:2-(3-amino-3-carboxypropyl)histidine synthase
MLAAKGVEYEPWRAGEDPVPAALNALPMLPERVALASTIQHSGKLVEVKKVLAAKGKKVVIVPKGERCSEEGQILGCDVSGALKVKDRVDAFLFIGSGRFHPLGLAYYTGKPVVSANPFTGEVERVDATEWLRGRSLRQTKALNAKSFGVIVSSKPGQKRLKQAEEIRETLVKHGFKAYIIVVDELTPDKLLGLDIDAFVVTACPRIVIDDWKNYSKALLLPDELEPYL